MAHTDNNTSYVSVHALNGGYLTLPERFFVEPLEDEEAKKTVPSLAFLIQHENGSKKTRILFDLGLRRELSEYSAVIQEHCTTRQPLSGTPDVVSSLAEGGLVPSSIDFIVLSHVHWDHIGTPPDFPTAQFLLGPGAKALLDGSVKLGNGRHSNFEKHLLPMDRTFELDVPKAQESYGSEDSGENANTTLSWGERLPQSILSETWNQKGIFTHTKDMFGDGSVTIVMAPGHLPGHINLICRLRDGSHVYLAGDACHDVRLLTGEKNIATWRDENAADVVCCIHADKRAAERTIVDIRKAAEGRSGLGDVEVVFAHDAAWEQKAKQSGRFFPGQL